MRRLFLIVLLLGILFPVAAVRDISLEARLRFDALFSPEWMHWLMHAALFAGLALLLPVSHRQPLRLVDGLYVLGIIVLTGMLQEAFQVIQKGFLYPAGVILDLWIDLGGGFVGLALAQLIACGRDSFQQRKALKHE